LRFMHFPFSIFRFPGFHALLLVVLARLYHKMCFFFFVFVFLATSLPLEVKS